MITLGEKLKSLRKLHGFSLAAVHEGTGLSISFLSDLEQGRSNPSLASLVSIANFYGLSVVDLLQDVNLGENLKSAKLPPGLEEFLRSEQVEHNLQSLLIQLAIKANQKPRTGEDWRKFYYALLVILGK
jgi:transcriptional regulator with XRE-family HTH domain